MNDQINALKGNLSDLQLMLDKNPNQWDWKTIKAILCGFGVVVEFISEAWPNNMLLIKEILHVIGSALMSQCNSDGKVISNNELKS